MQSYNYIISNYVVVAGLDYPVGKGGSKNAPLDKIQFLNNEFF